ncbi:MAG: glycosyl transferase family 36 [Xanthomonadales bacterium]|nr:glycosyl transferase family 36 [Xanthomonadales bacterium]
MLDVIVDGDRDAEVRRVTLVNHDERIRNIMLTSYAELVLGCMAADAAHPAFSKMFVETEWVAADGILLATRRHRTPDDPHVWAAHVASVVDEDTKTIEFESDRARFIGRGRTLRNAIAMQPDCTLSNTAGCVLDPVLSLRRYVHVGAGASVRIEFWTCAAATREAALELARELTAEAAFGIAQASAARYLANESERLAIGKSATQRCQKFVHPLLYADPLWRASPMQIQAASGGAPILWAKGISGDRPIISMRIAKIADLDHVRDLLGAQRFWCGRRLDVDVVLLDVTSSREEAPLQVALQALAKERIESLQAEREGAVAAVFVLRDLDIDQGLRDGLAAVARVVLDAASSGMDRAVDSHDMRVQSEQIDAAGFRRPTLPLSNAADVTSGALLDRGSKATEFDCGYGGFADRGRSYVITLDAERCTPMPWTNVIANPQFGFLATAEGGGHTFAVNSQQNPLTPWPNDPVSDAPHEILYLRDVDSGALWSATALPIRVPGASYRIEHGRGYSRYAHSAHGIETELTQLVPIGDPIKLSRLRICNRSGRARRLSITAYVEWALGANGTTSAPYVVTQLNPATGALFARNAWRPEFGKRVAFADLGGLQSSWTGDRAEFLGDLGALDRPAALARDTALSGRVGAALDPCAALQTTVDLAIDADVEIVFLLGQSESSMAAEALIMKYRAISSELVLQEVVSFWDDMLDTVQVRTPDRAMDLMLNGWLLYQVLACRLWARTAYYQSSGAYGFRDQLQDVMALCVAKPGIARQHLLRASARQFVEGDVQHWWLPPSGQGIRTRITDDRIWLPYVVLHYLGVTGDAAVLDESAPFLEGKPLKDSENESFFQPGVSSQTGSVYEHCARALDSSLSLGAHGLPLFGTGDWNDGMNRVGSGGKGESVWLAWLLLDTIERFAPLALKRSDQTRVRRWKAFAATVKAAIETAGWDGEWYRRGYYDDGSPLGSSSNKECTIDTIAQSWSVMSGQADPAHSVSAMQAVDARLIDRRNKIALLFTPPFEHTEKEPGYIKGYPPGVRENGGQYTHGSLWSIFAWAGLGDGDKAGELFDILNPIRHADGPEAIERFKVEPYISCADVYSVEPLTGHGGWTWYSGSAGWLYRAGLEAILGFRPCGDHLLIDPCIPKTWPAFSIAYRYHSSHYTIEVENPLGVCRGIARIELDGIPADSMTFVGTGVRLPLTDDARAHHVRVVLGRNERH